MNPTTTCYDGVLTLYYTRRPKDGRCIRADPTAVSMVSKNGTFKADTACVLLMINTKLEDLAMLAREQLPLMWDMTLNWMHEAGEALVCWNDEAVDSKSMRFSSTFKLLSVCLPIRRVKFGWKRASERWNDCGF